MKPAHGMPLAHQAQLSFPKLSLTKVPGHGGMSPAPPFTSSSTPNHRASVHEQTLSLLGSACSCEDLSNLEADPMINWEHVNIHMWTLKRSTATPLYVFRRARQRHQTDGAWSELCFSRGQSEQAKWSLVTLKAYKIFRGKLLYRLQFIIIYPWLRNKNI